VATTLTKADVLIELQKRDGDNLTATCRAVFDLDTDPDVPKTGQTVLVAFPVTGLGSDAGGCLPIRGLWLTVSGSPNCSDVLFGFFQGRIALSVQRHSGG